MTSPTVANTLCSTCYVPGTVLGLLYVSIRLHNCVCVVHM